MTVVNSERIASVYLRHLFSPQLPSESTLKRVEKFIHLLAGQEYAHKGALVRSRRSAGVGVPPEHGALLALPVLAPAEAEAPRPPEPGGRHGVLVPVLVGPVRPRLDGLGVGFGGHLRVDATHGVAQQPLRAAVGGVDVQPDVGPGVLGRRGPSAQVPSPDLQVDLLADLERKAAEEGRPQLLVGRLLDLVPGGPLGLVYDPRLLGGEIPREEGGGIDLRGCAFLDPPVGQSIGTVSVPQQLQQLESPIAAPSEDHGAKPPAQASNDGRLSYAWTLHCVDGQKRSMGGPVGLKTEKSKVFVRAFVRR